MDTTISARNDSCQREIFPSEIYLPIKGLLKCGMAKRHAPAPREIFLGEWLKRSGIGPTEAAEIAGCTQSYISNISSGARKNINALFLLRLSEHLKININDFFQRPPPESQIAPLRSLSPEAQEALLRPKKQKRG
jgi:DNA-binding Xre family transcriptional regulator